MFYNIKPRVFKRSVIAILTTLYFTVGCYWLGHLDPDPNKENYGFIEFWGVGILFSILIFIFLFIAVVIFKFVIDWIVED